MNNECSVLVLSCDANLDVVELNLRVMEKQWPDCPWTIFVGLEELSVDYCGSLDVRSLKSHGSPWSHRVKYYLDAIASDYVVIVLDDFIFEETVNTYEIQKALVYMKNKHCIANIAFCHFIGDKVVSNNEGYYECRVKNRPSLLNWQFGLWRKDALQSLLTDNESPWESELFGSLRAQYCSSYDFYCLNDDANMPVMYNRGWLIVRGVWNTNEVKRIEAKCNVVIHLGDRPQENIREIISPFHDKVKLHVKMFLYRCVLVMTRCKTGAR